MKKTLCCLLPALFCFLSAVLGQEVQGHITVDGRDRSFVLYLPKAAISANGDPTRPAPAAKLPLLLVLHGRFGYPKGTLRLADFRPIADREKVIVVYPAGIDRSWNDGRLKTSKNLNACEAIWAFFKSVPGRRQ